MLWLYFFSLFFFVFKVRVVLSFKQISFFLNELCIWFLLFSFNFNFSQSDENILKNLELFDKLCLRFNGRILFLKDIIANDEICCWMFYGNGKKVRRSIHRVRTPVTLVTEKLGMSILKGKVNSFVWLKYTMVHGLNMV